jgi:hypothetical protein
MIAADCICSAQAIPPLPLQNANMQNSVTRGRWCCLLQLHAVCGWLGGGFTISCVQLLFCWSLWNLLIADLISVSSTHACSLYVCHEKKAVITLWFASNFCMFSVFRIFYIAAFVSCFIACTPGRLTTWCTDLLFGDHMPDGLFALHRNCTWYSKSV